jgi:hypothetical protein
VSIETDAPEEQVKQFQEIVEEQRCVGHGTMMQPVAVESRWKINGKSVGGPAGSEADLCWILAVRDVTPFETPRKGFLRNGTSSPSPRRRV